MNGPMEAIACPKCGHPTRSPAHYIDVGRGKGVAAERDRVAAAVRDMRDNSRRLTQNMPAEIAIGFMAQEEVLDAVLDLIGDDT